MPILWTEVQFPETPETGGADPAVVEMAITEAMLRTFVPSTTPAGSGNGWRSRETRRATESRPHERP